MHALGTKFVTTDIIQWSGISASKLNFVLPVPNVVDARPSYSKLHHYPPTPLSSTKPISTSGEVSVGFNSFCYMVSPFPAYSVTYSTKNRFRTFCVAKGVFNLKFSFYIPPAHGFLH